MELRRTGVATTVPTPIEFQLPDGWLPAPPDEVGAPAAAFVALHPASADRQLAGFTANITIAGEIRDDGAPLTQLAEESVARLSTSATVRVASRVTDTSTTVPGLSQVLNIATRHGNAVHQLIQCQAYLDLTDATTPATRVVIELGLTATATQIQSLLPDFQSFIRTVRPTRPS
jgi:hypothetical protein